MNDDTTRGNGMMHRFWNPFAWYIFGVCTGAVGMVYQYEAHPKPQPVVQVERGHERSSGDHPASNPITHDAAPPMAHIKAEEARHLQRVKELRFSLEKLERAKAVQDAFLKQAANNRDDIHAMVSKLGEVGK